MSSPAPAPPAFVYECPGHAADVLRQLDEQRRDAASAGSSAGGLCDASVAAGGGRFPAHCAVLAACSDFFRAALALPPAAAAASPAGSGATTTERPPDVRTFNLPAEVTVKGLEQILHFAYTGKLYLSQDSYEDIHRTASVLRIRTLEEACFRFLQQKLGGRTDGQEPGKAHACGPAEPFQASRLPCFLPEKVASSSSSSGGSNSSRDGKVCSGGLRHMDDGEPSKAQACGLARPARAAFDPCSAPGDGSSGGGVFSRGWRRPADVSPQSSGPFERWNEGRSKRAETVTAGRWSPPETAHAFDPPRGPLPLLRCPLRDMDTSCRVIVSTIRTGGGGGRLGRDDKASAAELRSDVEVFEVEPGARLVTASSNLRRRRGPLTEQHGWPSRGRVAALGQRQTAPGCGCRSRPAAQTRLGFTRVR
ncbi:zinc finger and BTB domain-containing protein 7A-like [Lethenteron reissneri]|uniref:zinc finger and BTB domain-containing protein 7A-like n=1 Tax=Lethenteron reissneri TaxID=7753 RepID=UPI002AB6CADA|nr:zinc finger and BTB domain-containing protein 7A-like [Lethenteron reissneri]XP_061430775.1 zinc finger and BTB domain-containing protein 7A-like [Lethenteron reissneri]XP_061430776.1 zinc finger and BTB domain-containing protein 7A-like [Lethenteron reissneri]XP_061430777.1 zinc finger and BTB domain-containing protein 7A-like [Lethenteron reissneri]